MRWKTGNIYIITAISVIGGGLFGSDISSMSAITSTKPYLCYFNQGADGPPLQTLNIALVQNLILRAASQQQWQRFLASSTCRKGKYCFKHSDWGLTLSHARTHPKSQFTERNATCRRRPGGVKSRYPLFIHREGCMYLYAKPRSRFPRSTSQNASF
jgi:hypothetical protein